MNITTTELLDALAQANVIEEGVPPNTYSGSQIMDILGVGHGKFSTMMRGYLSDGTVRLVQVRKRALDGRLCRVTNYQFVVPTKRKK